MSDHKYIYLQPECCADPDEGRHWCQDPDPVDCDDGKHWTKYILFSEFEAVKQGRDEIKKSYVKCTKANEQLHKRIEALEEALGNVKKHMEVASPGGHRLSGAWNIANNALKRSGVVKQELADEEKQK